ncbi:hypothetical protein ACKWTF_009753 [Chironomus riparius]
MITNDNHKLVDNQSSLNNNCTSSTNTVVANYCENMSLKISEFIASSRHGYVKEPPPASITSAAAVLSYSEDRINNNFAVSKTSHGVDSMSHKNFTLSFDQHLNPNTSTVASSSSSTSQMLLSDSETLLSPAEAPFGRRYAEISQFKNHPNVEWSIEDNNNSQEPQDQHTPESFYDEADNDNIKADELAMDINKEKSDDEELLLSKEFLESAAEEESSSDGGVLAEGETSSSESERSSSPSPQCDISLMERLLRTHPVWFLPSLQRGGSVHLLQGKEIGTFIVRGSSQKNTMAISVRLPKDAGPYIEHYLIQSNNGLLNLESSRFKFDSIPALVAHYSNCCDELPVQLSLPRGLREAKNRQRLMSLALLGPEFWRCPVASPVQEDETSLNSQIKSPTDTSGICTMAEFSSMKQQKNSIFTNNKLNFKHNNNNNQQTVDTPSDTASLGSFPASGGASTILSPQSADNVFIASPSSDFCNLKSNSNSINNLNSPSGIIGKTSTFKAQTFSMTSSTSQQQLPQQQKLLQNRTVDTNADFQHHVLPNDAINKRDDNHIEEFVQRTRPTPPNTLNLAIAGRAPVPPKRWLKPCTPTSPFIEQNTLQTNNNFTVTTTFTFNVAKQKSQHKQPQQHHTSEIEIPPRNIIYLDPKQVPIISERLSPEGGESKTNSDSSLQKWETNKSSSINPFKTNESIRSKRQSSRRKESKHYQESDILESPSVYMEYCRSNLGDKISDYEDLWTQENNSRSSLHIAVDQNNQNNIVNNNTSKECEISTPMVISPPQQFTPTSSITPALIGSEIAITTNSSTPLQPKIPTLFDSNKKSPFYSDPVDAVAPVFPQIVRREPKLNPLPSFHRYSEPPKGQFEDLNFHISSSPMTHEKGIQQQSFIAASLDHLKSINKSVNNQNHRHRLEPTWTVDSSWEFVDKNDESSENGSTRNLRQITPQNTLHYQNTNNKHLQHQKFNTIERNAQCSVTVDSYLMNSKKSNIYKLVAKKYPDINLKGGMTTTQSNIPSTWQTFESDGSNKFQRLSSYDNVIEQQSIYGGSEDGTLFSEPWDSSQWDSFFPTTEDSSTIHLSKCRPAISEDETIIEDSSAISKSNANTIQRNPLLQSQKIATVLRHRSGCFKDREILKHPRNKTEQNDPAQAIEAYTLALAQDETSIFGQNIHNFIACTRESKEKIPQKVMRNMRQFMNGMKNFLAKHGEKRFDEEVDNARLALNRDEFLNLDQILEGVMHQLVVAPLRDYLNELFVDYYGASGDIQLIIDNMLHAQNKDPFIFGVRKSIKPPPQHVINRIAMMFAKLHEAELPSEKLDLLLNTITVILENTIDTETDLKDGTHLLCDDFLPLFVYVMCKCGFHFAEVEAEYMWGLMHPTQMSGQPGYYVTSLCSAALIVKDMKSKIDQENADGGVVSVRENDNSLDSGYQL